MGQYRQWLHKREVDQRLQAQLELLELELQHLQEQAAQLEDETSFTENPIIQAIAMQQSAEALFVDIPEISPITASFSSHAATDALSGKTVSAALFAWSHLPNLDTQEIPLQTAPFTDQETGENISLSPLSGDTLLPEDLGAFIDTHTQTIPQLHIPQRPAQLKVETTSEQKITPDDRTDYSIQRWRERWGRPQSPNGNTTSHPSPLPDQGQSREDRAR